MNYTVCLLERGTMHVACDGEIARSIMAHTIFPLMVVVFALVVVLACIQWSRES
jgi:hypothetical protein